MILVILLLYANIVNEWMNGGSVNEKKKLNSSPKERKKEKEEHGKLADGTRLLFWPPISHHDGRTVTVASRVIKNNASLLR